LPGEEIGGGGVVKGLWRRLLFVLGGLLVVAALGGAFVFKWVQNRLHAPKLIVREAAPVDLYFQTLDGAGHHLSEFKGKVVYLDLWGTWCIQCVAEMPTVQTLYDHYKDDSSVVFLIVSRLDSPHAVSRFARVNHYDLPFYVTRDDDVPDSMYLRQYPATFIYGKDGSLVTQHAGGADWADSSVIRFIDQLKNR
jgi:thiol-disulfide isomerase/thioredoxin